MGLWDSLIDALVWKSLAKLSLRLLLFSRQVVSYSLWPHGLQPARLLCPRDFPGKNTGVGCHFLLQGIFLTLGRNLHPLHGQEDSLPLSLQGSPKLALGGIIISFCITLFLLFTQHQLWSDSSFSHSFLLISFNLCDPMDCNPPGSSVHGILQARILEWVAIPFSRSSFWPRDRTWVSYIISRFFTIWAIRRVHASSKIVLNNPCLLEFTSLCVPLPLSVGLIDWLLMNRIWQN